MTKLMDAKLSIYIDELSKKENITIIYCCIMGSYNWGLNTDKSDKDIKGIFIRNNIWDIAYPKKNYKNVIRYNTYLDDIEHDFELWDLTKSVDMLKRSNTSIIEWIQSSHVIINKKFLDTTIKDIFLDTISKIQSTKTVKHHYYNMLVKNLKIHFDSSEEVLLKKYFFVLIPTLYLIQLNSTNNVIINPNFISLVKNTTLNNDIKKIVLELIDKKLSNEGSNKIKKIVALDSWIYLIKQQIEEELFNTNNSSKSLLKKSSLPSLYDNAVKNISSFKKMAIESNSIKKKLILNIIHSIFSTLYLYNHPSSSKKDIEKKKVLELIPNSIDNDAEINKILNSIVSSKDTFINISDYNLLSIINTLEKYIIDIEDGIKLMKKYNQDIVENNRQIHYNGTLKILDEEYYRDILIKVTKYFSYI